MVPTGLGRARIRSRVGVYCGLGAEWKLKLKQSGSINQQAAVADEMTRRNLSSKKEQMTLI